MRQSIDGVLVVDKPVGPTSHDAVARVRRVFDEPRVGHTGTLDPAASGVLPMVIGRATRLARFLSAADKTYDALVRIGFSTETGDAEGAPLSPVWSGGMPSISDVKAALDGFRGTFLQQPPLYSAKKIGGQPSYRIARRSKRHQSEGVAPPAAPPLVSVTVHAIDVIGIDDDRLSLRLSCSAGFYVRALARDLGERLGTGGHLIALRRTRSGDFTIRDAMPLQEIERDREAACAAIIPLSGMLRELRSVVLTAEGVKRASHGRDLGPEDLLEGTIDGAEPPRVQWIRLLNQHGELLGLAESITDAAVLHPSVVLM
jgi:tRNA pseudouridine55 synthase